ncbi:helix-turn-helix domain-containing protein [Acetobacter senegalensis]|uniref:IclR family transcriptional regulator domain-containing protein n=1 Tax=Acetobacter senegalensis TaxID=446692 RepID=UPI001EDB8181|nr:IclR family transcriptional regulator C-terminal domain-containing protein [Acetobacter senegalensis]MCG4262465.1 helix-turn-helix domain-containing protein [Acetobacter senegalensis]
MTKLRSKDVARREEKGVGRDYSEALARGLAIICTFSAEKRRMTLSEIAREVDLPKATVRRTLITLEQLGYMRSEGRLFTLTPDILRIARAYLTCNAISDIIQPACERLTKTTDEGTAAAVIHNDEVVMIARSVPAQAALLDVGIGFRISAYNSALGRILLSDKTDDKLAAYFAATPLKKSTPFTITDPEVIKDEVLAARKNGFAYACQEAEYGYHSVAVPLRKFNGSMVAALHIGTRIEKVTREEMLSHFMPMLMEEAERLNRQLI